MDSHYSARFLDVLRAYPTAGQHSGNQAVLLGLYSAIIRGDFDGMAEFLDVDVELQISGGGPFDGTWRGRNETIEAARLNFGQLSEQQPEIESVIHDGESAASLFRETGVFNSDGRRYRLRVVQWFTFSKGKVLGIKEIVAVDPVATKS